MKKFYVLLVCLTVSRVSNALVECINGETNFNDTCDCFQGWSGETCDRCGGRIRYITIDSLDYVYVVEIVYDIT